MRSYSVKKRFLWLALPAFLACGGDSTGPGVDAVGTWNLVTVDGRALPTFVPTGVGVPAVEIQLSQIVIRSDGSFTDTYTLRPMLSNTATTFHEPGTWVKDGRVVTLTYSSNGSSGTGTLIDDILTMDFDGAWVFRRE
jgi:hypothetical protein